jgi:hypothetical protein
LSSSPTEDVYVDKPWLLMRWDSEHGCVFAEWKAFATSTEFQGALMKALEAGRSRPGFSFVNDTRKLELISDEDQRWIQYMWTPLAIEAGMRRIAVVMARRGLSKMAIERMFRERRNRDNRLQSQTFDSVADAFNWVAEP